MTDYVINEDESWNSIKSN